ncbi:MAG: hypothetical protein PWP49_1200 [Thermococcaceae archaeon]|nr:MAG: hypothetical protein XD43_0881 [Thermococcales archaeon 44_46]MDK2783051.1 hypothetical protein [Thermococcaceae archaeon]MDK2983602.1 hypothetical protein [Thermococcaceae archaeon]MDN5320780.1 hypothetical protein [Thermococcaceae archaeon]HIH72575.1 hypothetical protein [Thermococcaceae archaeon]
MNPLVYFLYIPLKSEIEIETVTEDEIQREELTGNEAEEFLEFLERDIFRLARQNYDEDDFIKRSLIRRVKRIIKRHDSDELETLLLDFLENGTATSMRAEGKYVIAILYEDKLYLIHSKIKERSMGREEETHSFKIYERFLDRDNLYRFVVFVLDDDALKARMYLKHDSNKTFLEWLGIPPKKRPLPENLMVKFVGTFGNYRLSIELDIDTMLKLEERMEGGRATYEDICIDLNKGKLKIGELSLNIDYGIFSTFRKRIPKDKLGELFYYAKQLRSDWDYQLSYLESLPNGLGQIDLKSAFDASLGNPPYEERIDGLYHKETEKLILPKDGGDIILVYFNKNREKFIELSPDFLNTLAERILENSTLKVMVLNRDINPDEPVRIDNVYLYNRLPPEFSELLKKLPNDWKELSPTYRTLLKLSILNFIGSFNKQYYIFQRVLEYIQKTKQIADVDTIPEIEDIMEFKGRDALYNERGKPKDTKKIVDYLFDDILKKISGTNFKFYIIGINKNTRRIEPIEEGYFWDDIIREMIYEPLYERFKSKGLSISKPVKLPVRGGFILLFSVRIENPNLLRQQISSGFEALESITEGR